jgi:hypothetical protein
MDIKTPSAQAEGVFAFVGSRRSFDATPSRTVTGALSEIRSSSGISISFHHAFVALVDRVRDLKA